MSANLPGMRSRMNIKALRDRLGASQEELADELHVDVRTIRRWESGSVNPSPMAIAHLQQLRARQRDERGQGGADSAVHEAQESTPYEQREASMDGSALPRRRMPVL